MKFGAQNMTHMELETLVETLRKMNMAVFFQKVGEQTVVMTEDMCKSAI